MAGNTYPGCRVDVSNHVYSYSFMQNMIGLTIIPLKMFYQIISMIAQRNLEYERTSGLIRQ